MADHQSVRWSWLQVKLTCLFQWTRCLHICLSKCAWMNVWFVWFALMCIHMKRLWNHVRNFCHVSTTSLVIPSECGTLIYPIAKIQGLSVDPQPRKLWPGLPGSLPGFGKQKHHEATGSGKKKQLIPVEQSRKVWIPQLLRTSKSSTQEGFFYHCLSVFHVKDSSDWTLDTVPEGRVFALVLTSGSIQLKLCYNESDNMLQSCQIRQVEPPIWCHLISL